MANTMNKIPIDAKILNGVSFDNMIKSFIGKILSQEGMDYCWPTPSNSYSGKGYKSSQYVDTRDCSGCVTFALHELLSTDFRNTHNAQKLHDECHPIDAPGEGCLVFYGSDANHVSHVMTYLSDGRVFGASGGNSKTVTPEIAKQMNANVRYQSNYKYRSDFVSFGRIFVKH
jgi:cell wall-associated NlpC family hydrolase